MSVHMYITLRAAAKLVMVGETSLDNFCLKCCAVVFEKWIKQLVLIWMIDFAWHFVGLLFVTSQKVYWPLQLLTVTCFKSWSYKCPLTLWQIFLQNEYLNFMVNSPKIYNWIVNIFNSVSPLTPRLSSVGPLLPNDQHLTNIYYECLPTLAFTNVAIAHTRFTNNTNGLSTLMKIDGWWPSSQHLLKFRNAS